MGEVHEVDVVVGVVTKDAAAHGFTEEGEEGEETTNVAEAIIKLTAQQSPCAGCVASATEPCYVLACRLSIWRTEWRSSETSNFAGAVAFRFTDVKEQHRRVHRSQMGLFRRKLCPKKIREDKQGHKNNNKCFYIKFPTFFLKWARWELPRRLPHRRRTHVTEGRSFLTRVSWSAYVCERSQLHLP